MPWGEIEVPRKDFFFFLSTNDPPGGETKNSCLQADKVVVWEKQKGGGTKHLTVRISIPGFGTQHDMASLGHYNIYHW